MAAKEREQELYAEILDDVPGALWTNAMFWDHRRRLETVDMARVVVAVDPAVTNKDKSDENGIVILSGMLHAQSARVIAAYEAQGFEFKKRYESGEWTTLVLRR